MLIENLYKPSQTILLIVHFGNKFWFKFKFEILKKILTVFVQNPFPPWQAIAFFLFQTLGRQGMPKLNWFGLKNYLKFVMSKNAKFKNWLFKKSEISLGNLVFSYAK